VGFYCKEAVQAAQERSSPCEGDPPLDDIRRQLGRRLCRIILDPRFRGDTPG
jgi:hypothetical protein